MRYDDDELMMPRDMSYFEEMCWRAENDIDPESRGHAQFEVDRMVAALNEAEEADRTMKEFTLKDHIECEVGSMFEGFYFEPNDRKTRAELALIATKFMEDLRKHGHIEEFEVVCDETNNTPSTIDRNELHLTIILNRGHSLKAEVMKFTSAKAAVMAVDVDIDITQSGNHGGYTAGQGISISPANASGSNGSVGSSVNIGGGGNPYGYSYNLSVSGGLNGISSSDLDKITLIDPITNNPDLPKTMFYTHDDNGKRVVLTLDTERDMSAHEALLLARLIHAATTSPSSFSVFHFVRKQGLERHFKFAEA